MLPWSAHPSIYWEDEVSVRQEPSREQRQASPIERYLFLCHVQILKGVNPVVMGRFKTRYPMRSTLSNNFLRYIILLYHSAF